MQVKTIAADYATKTVTFALSWAAGTRNATHNSKVWVFVDYQEVTNPHATGAWQRANIDLSKLPAGGSADGANTKGFWYQGQATAAQSATITVALTNVPAKFNWCAYATDYPPVVEINSGTNVVLKGTAPFLVTYTDGSTETLPKTGNTFALTASKTINAITDNTNAPGMVSCLTRDKISVNGYCCTGQTIVNGYCRDLAADNAIKIVGCGTELELIKTNYPVSPGAAYSVACPAGWRTATIQEYSCIWRTYGTNSSMSASIWYMTNQSLTSGHWVGVSPCMSCVAYWSYVVPPSGFVNGTCSAAIDAAGGIMYPQCRDGMGTTRHYKCLR